MNLQEFLKTIEALDAIPPALRTQLVGLAPHLTDAERAETVQSLKGSNERIGKIADDMVGAFDKGIAELEHYQKTEVAEQVGKAEEEDRAAADKIFDDASASGHA